MTQRRILAIVIVGWGVFVLGVGLLPFDWAVPAAIALAGAGMAGVGLLGIEVSR